MICVWVNLPHQNLISLPYLIQL